MNKLIMTIILFVSSVVADKIKISDVEAAYVTKSIKVKKKGLTQNINFGFANTTGNTETLNINAKYVLTYITVGYKERDLKVAFDTSAFVTESSGLRDNEEYIVNLGLEQDIVSGWIGYTSVHWLQNTFRNFDNKVLFGAGVGKELLHDSQYSLQIKLGIAYNVEQYTNNQADHKFTSLTQYVEYSNHLNEMSLLYLKIGASENLSDFGDYEILGVVGFNFAVAESISVSIEEEVRYDKIPPVGFARTDTKTIIRVGYNF